jgi:hypothetical protein
VVRRIDALAASHAPVPGMTDAAGARPATGAPDPPAPAGGTPLPVPGGPSPAPSAERQKARRRIESVLDKLTHTRKP